MKNSLFLLIALIGTSMLTCGPSATEIKQKQAEIKKAISDSLALVYEEKAIADSLSKVYEEKARFEEEKRLQAEREKEITDSIVQAYEAQLKKKENSPTELRKDLITIERENPLRYLKVTFELDFKMIGGKDVVKGKVTNRATLAKYKDIELEVYCFSGTKTLIKTIRKTIYEYIQPRSSQSFEYKFKSPKPTKTIGVKIVGAKAI